MLTFKSLKQRKIVEILTLSESRVYWNEESANFGDYSGDFVLLSWDREMRSKIWSLPDYPGELTALTIFTSPGDGNRHFTCSSEPLEGPAACNAKGVP